MSQPTTIPPFTTSEKTFSNYNTAQSQAYALIRRDYHNSVYSTILSHHTSTGGRLDSLLDIGCGPGTATTHLAPLFSSATGLDPSPGMIATAVSLSTKTLTSTSQPITYALSSAETLGSHLSPSIGPNSIDLITAANAAHWFDMPAFWNRAAIVLKPGGSVALWTSGHLYPHPDMPNAAKIQIAMDDIYASHLRPFEEPGNVLTRDGYRDLPLPWNITPAVEVFEEGSFYRREWTQGEQFFAGEPEVDLDTYEKMMGTGSPVTRWREANGALVGTEGDVVRLLRREIERLLREEGVQEGKEMVRGAARGVVLVVKKKMGEEGEYSWK